MSKSLGCLLQCWINPELRFCRIKSHISPQQLCLWLFVLSFAPLKVLQRSLPRSRINLYCEFRCSDKEVKGCTRVFLASMSTYTRVFREPVLTQTQPLHCPPPSVARMFEGRLTAWLPLVSAGTKHPAAGRPRPPEDAVSAGTREAQDRDYSWKGYFSKIVDRLIIDSSWAVLKIADSRITRGISLNLWSNPPIK